MRERTNESPVGAGDAASPRPRRLELLLKSAWLRLLADVHGGSRPLAAPDWDARPHRVLLLRHDGIGDLIVSLPLIDAVTRAHPTMVLDVLASRANAPLLEGRPSVSAVIVHDRANGARDTLRRLRAGGYDAVIDGRVVTEGVNPHAAKLMFATGARYRIGLGGRHNDWIYTLAVIPRRSPRHVVEYLAALAGPLNVNPDVAQARPSLELAAGERDAALATWRAVPGAGTRFLVNLSAGNVDRRWPDQRFMAVLQHVRELHPTAAILVIGLPVDGQSVERIAAAVGGVAFVPPLRATLALVATADMVFTPDTAIAHMASAFERPTVTMLRRGFERWIPYRTPGRNVFGSSCATLAALDVEPVAEAVLAVLADLQADSG